MSKYKEFTRSELYDLVWATPMTKLAKQFGLSDVGLRKICVKHNIPTPPLGYWAKLQFGKRPKQPNLPPLARGELDRVFVTISAVNEMPEKVILAESQARKSIGEKLNISDQAHKPRHPIARATKRALREATLDNEGFISTASVAGTIKVIVARPTVPRVTAIIEAIATTLEQRGQQLIKTDNGVDLIVDGERLKLTVHETKSQQPHQPTRAELAAKDKWEQDRIKWPSIYDSNRMHWRRWDYSPSGRLCLQLEDPDAYSWRPERILGRWYDRKTSQLEDYLNEIIIKMHAGAALVRHRLDVAAEEERLRQEAEDRRLREQERRERVAKREAFIEEKATLYAKLTKLQSFGKYLSNQSSDPNAALAAVNRVAQEMIERLSKSLSAYALNEEIERRGLYTSEDL